jgi:hypothetical protein
VDLHQIVTRGPIVSSGLALGVAVLLVAGCSSKHQKATPSPTAAAPASSPSAASQLAAVASVAGSAGYDATYTAHSDAQASEPARTSTIQVFRTATQTRLDVDEQSTQVLIQVDANGTSSCTVSTGTPDACVLLAGPDASIPANVPDPGLQHTFTSSLTVLAAGTGLTVARAPGIPAAAGLPAASCYAVMAAPDRTVSPGTYCFSATGVVVRVQFRSSLLQLTAIGEQPTASDFSLPASPVPVSSR